MNLNSLYFLITPSLIGGMIVPIVKNSNQIASETQTIHHYFFRLPLLSEKNKNDSKLLLEDRARLEGYYKKYFSYPTSVNNITKHRYQSMEGNGNPNFFVQVQRSDLVEHKDWEWLKTVRLNQFTIDRLLEKKSEDTSLTAATLYSKILETEHLMPEHFKLSKNTFNYDAIDIFFKNKTIPKEEISHLVYFPSERIGTKRWFVWLDKDILKLKLNLGFQIWFFNQPHLRSHKFVKDLFSSKSSWKEKIALRKRLKSLYKELKEGEKQFFDFYYRERWIKNKSGDSESLSLKAEEINDEEVNQIYNLLREKSFNLDIFKSHLVQIVQGGDKSSFENFFPGFVTYATGPDSFYELKGEDKYKEDAKFTITPDRSLNSGWDVQELLDITKNYSVRNYTLRTIDNSRPQWPSIVLNSNEPNYFPVIRETYFEEKRTI